MTGLLARGYPYQERESKAHEICNYLSEHEGEFSVFLDLYYNGNSFSHVDFYSGKISSPFIRYTPGENLSFVVEEGMMIKKKIMNYNIAFLTPAVGKPDDQRPPFLEGLIIKPSEIKEGIFQSKHMPFCEDDYHYVLVAGEENVLTYLHGRKVISEPTQEFLQSILSKRFL